MTADQDFKRLDDLFKDKSEIADKIVRSGPDICDIMRTTAIMRLEQLVYSTPESWYRRTHNLAQSVMDSGGDIIARPDDSTVIVGITASADYAKYIEFGTGANGSNEYDGHISEGVTFKDKKSWMFKDEWGETHIAKAQHPRPFMRPALWDNIDNIKRKLTEMLTEGFL